MRLGSFDSWPRGQQKGQKSRDLVKRLRSGGLRIEMSSGLDELEVSRDVGKKCLQANIKSNSIHNSQTGLYFARGT